MTGRGSLPRVMQEQLQFLRHIAPELRVFKYGPKSRMSRDGGLLVNNYTDMQVIPEALD